MRFEENQQEQKERVPASLMKISRDTISTENAFHSFDSLKRSEMASIFASLLVNDF